MADDTDTQAWKKATDPSTGRPQVTVGLSGPKIGDVDEGEPWLKYQKQPKPGDVEIGKPWEKYKKKSGQPAWQSGIEGSVRANVEGELSGLATALGGPVDIVNAGLSPIEQKIGLTPTEEPFGGSASFRHLFNLPGTTAAEVYNLINGPNSASRIGLGGHVTYDDINEVPESYRPQARAGEVIGETIGSFLPIEGVAAMASPAARIGAATTTTGNAVKDIGNQVLAAASKPGFARKALPSTTGAAVGAYGAETADPGSPTAQFIAQLAGGMGPAALTAGAGRASSTAAKALDPFLAKTDEGAKTIIARSLGKEFEKAGEQPSTAISNLKTEPIIPGASPAERSGSPVLMGVERTLAETNPDLANRLEKQNAQFLQNIKLHIDSAFIPGERGALTRAAQQIKTSLDNYVSIAEKAAANAASQVDVMPSESREALNVQARQILESALSNARKGENELWAQVPKEISLEASHAVNAFNKVKGEMLKEATLPNLVERVMTRLKKKPATTLGELQALRSELLGQSRIARSMHDFNTARRLELIGDGVLSDMEAAGGDAAKIARSFSRELNDRFSRSFAGDILGLKASGAPAVRPSLTLETAVAGKPQTVAEKLKELQIAASPIPKQIDAQGHIIKPTTLLPEMRQVQEQFLQSLSSRIINVQTGRIEPGKAAAFLRDYAPVLDQFPIYEKQVNDALTAELGALRIAGMMQDTDRLAFNQVLSAGELPMHAVAKILASKTPAKDFVDLANMATKAGKAATAGLRAAILDFVADRAVKNGVISYQRMRDELLIPLYPKGPSLLSLMQANGVVTSTQADAITARLGVAMAHENAAKQALRIDTVGDEAGKLARWSARIIGAKLSSKLGFTHGGAGPSLQVAQIAASAAEQAVAKLPLDRARKVLTDALATDNPDQLIDILERISNTDAATKTSANIGYLIPLLRTLYPHSKTKADWMSPGDTAVAPPGAPPVSKKQSSIQDNHPILKTAKRAKDGKFYVSDPSRPGKYLMVNNA